MELICNYTHRIRTTYRLILRVQNNELIPADITGIQNRLLLATGTSQDLDEMLQSFMVEAVAQLRLANVYVYLLDRDRSGNGNNLSLIHI